MHIGIGINLTGGSFRAASLKDYAANNVTPVLVADFEKQSYLGGNGAGFSNVLTLTRASAATYTDVNGNIQTSLTDVARFDYQTGRCGLLVEGQRANLLLYSAAVAGAGSMWYATGGGCTAVNQSLGILSVFNGVLVTTGGATWHRLSSADMALSTGVTYAFKVWAKTGTSGKVNIIIRNNAGSVESSINGNMNLASPTISSVAGTLTLVNAKEVETDVWCYEILFTPTTGANFSLGVGPFSNSGGNITVLGGQVEAGDFSTSYIPTTTATVTRAADVLTLTPSQMNGNILPAGAMPSAASFAIEGAMSYADKNSAIDLYFYDWRVDSSNYLDCVLQTSGADTGQILTEHNNAGTYDTVSGPADTYAAGVYVPFRVAVRHGATELNAAADGASFTANTTLAGLPDLSSVSFELTDKFNGVLYNFVAWAEDIDDDGIEEATT